MDTQEQDQDYEFELEYYFEQEQTEAHVQFAPNFQQELFHNQIDLNDFLINHSISQQRRALMVKWIIYVFDTIYENQNNDVLISRAIHLMDIFLKRTQVSYSDKDVHLIGATCIYMASKIKNDCPLDMETIQVTICHEKFTIDEIKEFYFIILKTLDYNTEFPTCYDYLQNLSYAMYGSSQNYQTLQVQETALKILKLSFRSYQLMQQNWLILVTTVLGIAIIDFEQVNGYYRDLQGQNNFLNDQIIRLIETANINVAEFKNCYEILSQFNCRCSEIHCSRLF
ncbi:unnamed protein product (macronuclear) [Paramecium tetraurelia]|uniref:Cyclin-like domain-containing protein n=1 Tax=Paramecium tetraurelia TaxID=5888 RepID=A0C6F9_PARTE|nr:uncharacterized protein GSPATT00035505001 [Paramecium tetraurelia]CAK66376.1 unnamed protein product [Paramecium tetraurelia]|eukprot:XP_001433773.1 hypothetical protein (macronuclear) [Paramecium tetraurelia strain d4-2]